MCARSASPDRASARECRRAHRRAVSPPTSSPIQVPWPETANYMPCRTDGTQPQRPVLRFRGNKRCVQERPFVSFLSAYRVVGMRPRTIGCRPGVTP
jgi:hypothetical protein